jgi:hypothetical protein
MKIPFLSCVSLLTMVACTAQQSSTDSLGTPWAGAGQNAGPAHVGGSAANTTTAFDGTYQGVSNRSASMAGTGKKTFEANIPGCQQFEVPPTLTVSNGLAQFQAMGVTFAGYVTPQGHLTMHSGYGATATGQAKPALVDEDLDGNFDTQTHVLHARVSSINCTYDVNWQRVT